MLSTGRKALGQKVSGDSSEQVNTFTFLVYGFFLIGFFLHFSARIPVIGAFRPTLLLVLLITMLLVLQKEKLKGWTREPVMRAMLIFLAYLAFSLPFVEWQGSVIRNNLSDFVRSIVFLFFTVLIIDSEKRLRIFLFIFVGAQLFRVFEPLYLHLTTGYWGSSTYLGAGEFSDRLSGAPYDVINPNELGFVIVTIIPFLHYLVWPGRIWAKLFYILTMPALLYALILTQSRGAMLALLVIAWMIFKVSKRKVMLIGLAVVIAIGGWSVMNTQQKDRYLSLVGMSQVGGGNADSVDGRLSGMLGEFKLAMSRPVVGHGLGTTPEVKAHKLGSSQAAHNFYAEILVETGILGFAFFMRFIFQVYRKLRDNGSRLEGLEQADHLAFYSRLNQTMIAVFWMYAVYSTNYWGLSQYYWYLFAGLCIVFSRRLANRLNDAPENNPAPEENRMRFGPNRARTPGYAKGISR